MIALVPRSQRRLIRSRKLTRPKHTATHPHAVAQTCDHARVLTLKPSTQQHDHYALTLALTTNAHHLVLSQSYLTDRGTTVLRRVTRAHERTQGAATHLHERSFHARS